MRRIALPLVFCLLALAPTAFAEDETPASRFAARTKAFGAPTAERGFDVEGQVRIGDQVFGTFRLAASPETIGEGEAARVVWKLTDTIDVANGQFGLFQESLVASDLEPIRGSERAHEPSQSHAGTFERVEAGIKHVVTPKDGEVSETVHPVEGRCITNLASLVLFSRLALPADGKAGPAFATVIFDPSDALDEDPVMQSGHIELVGPDKWDAVEAFVVRCRKNDEDTIRVALDPATGGLMGIEIETPSGPAFRLVPGEAAPEPEPTGFWAEHPKTAKQAALQAALAFAAADFEIIDRVTHWPTVYERVHEAERAEVGSAELYHAAVMQSLRQQLTPQAPRELLEAVLPVTELEEVAQEDGTVLVQFPEQFRGLALIVGELDGRWYVMQLPGQ